MWKDTQYRFYFQNFYIPDNAKFVDGGNIIWAIFKIEIVKGDSVDNIRCNIELIISSLKLMIPDIAKRIKVADVIIYTEGYFKNKSDWLNWGM